MPVHSLPQLSFVFLNIFQPTKCTFNVIHFVIGFARQVLDVMRRKRTFGEITWKRIVGNENITCLTILAPALGDFAVIRDKLVVLKHIKNLHLTWLNLDEPVCIPIPQCVVITDNIVQFGDVPKDLTWDTCKSVKKFYLVFSMVNMESILWRQIEDKNFRHFEG